MHISNGSCVYRCFFQCETLPCRQTSPLRARFQAKFLRPGATPSDDETVTSVRASRRRTFAQAAAQRFVASISQESLPSTSEHALRHHRLRRCAARPAALTGWALLAGLLWLPYGGLLKLATSAVRASARGLLSSGPHIAHKSVSLPSAHFFLPLRGAGRLSAQKGSS